MQTHRSNPWSIFDALERSMPATSAPQAPTFAIEDTEDATLLTADVPGMGESDIEITLHAPDLIVRGERKGRKQVTFERRFRIGEAYNPDNVTAHIANGELTIRLEKAAAAKPRKITLSAAAKSPPGLESKS